MELDIVAYHPKSQELRHYEPSLDAHNWDKRLKRYQKKFEAGRKYIFKDIFPWLPHSVVLRQIAVFPSHPDGRDNLAGGEIISVDELMAEICAKVVCNGAAYRAANSEQFPLLRTIQLSHVGYHRVIKQDGSEAKKRANSER